MLSNLKVNYNKISIKCKDQTVKELTTAKGTNQAELNHNFNSTSGEENSSIQKTWSTDKYKLVSNSD